MPRRTAPFVPYKKGSYMHHTKAKSSKPYGYKTSKAKRLLIKKRLELLKLKDLSI